MRAALLLVVKVVVFHLMISVLFGYVLARLVEVWLRNNFEEPILECLVVLGSAYLAMYIGELARSHSVL